MKSLTIGEGFRLSPQQKHLWSLQKHSDAYKAQCTIRIVGDINFLSLQLALKNVIEKHDILRTTLYHRPEFKWPLQSIGSSDNVSWYDIDLSKLNTKEQKVEIEKILFEESQQNLDVIVSAYLFNLGVEQHILLLSLSAMNADTKTLNNLVSEIGRAYAACLNGKDYSVERERVLQYLQFSEWQNQLLEDEEELTNKAGKGYWSQHDFTALETLVAPYEHKVDRSRSQFAYKSLDCEISSIIVDRISKLAREYNTSIDVILLTLWQILIGRLNNQQELIVGTAFDGRPYQELDDSFGLFVKYLPIKISIESQDKFTEILQRVRESVITHIEWQDYFNYFETLGDANYPIGFEFSKLPSKYVTADVSFEVERYHVCLEQFKISLNCYQHEDKILANFLYDINSYEAKQIRYLAEQYLTLLESIVDDPQLAVSQLKILSDRQRQQLLVEFNQTTNHNFQQDLCIHQLFARQAEQTPDNIAVIFEDERLTYGELNDRADRLASYLQQLGVKPNVLVGICLERSHLSILAILAVLKAGGAYLPLEPTIPKERLHWILEDARVGVLLTQEKLTSNLPSHPARVLCVDRQQIYSVDVSDRHPVNNTNIDDLAYVIYTSGSTGTPKGVAVEHRQLSNYLHSIVEQIDLPNTASFATLSTFAADLGNTVVFSALCTGGCLHVISQERMTNPITLAEYCRHHRIDCFKIVPSHLNALLSSEHPEDILPSQLLILGGESLSWSLVKQIQQLKPNCRILNHYGPTETTVGVLTFKVERQEYPSSTTVPIGRPLANTQVYLLDEQLQPVPMFVPGEVYIGGTNLARGYFNRPDLTKERFIPNPFETLEENRLYKTGDVGRYLTDGNIEFLGRSDRQVKLRGFRIELEEIEAVLRQHPFIRQAISTVREDEMGNQRLVAYVVFASKDTGDLEEFARERLAEYTIPSAFVPLNTIPLTPNGKIDYQALPAPEREQNYVAPSTPQEEQLARIWAEVLGLKQVGVEDNFFQLGGDSILSIQVISKANQLGLQLTPQQLFEHPTIANLAAIAKTTNQIKTETGLVTGELPLTPIQHWFFAQNFPNPHHWNQSVFLEVRQNLDFQILERVIKELLRHHDALRLRFQLSEKGWRQVNVAPEEVVPVTKLDLSEQSEAEQEKTIALVATELQASLNLSNDPLIKVAYFDLGKDKLARLLIIIHHLAVDGISWRILLEDLQTAYQQLGQGKKIHLPAKTTAFKQWAEKLNEYARASALPSELEYWQNQTQRQITHLPTDFPEDGTVNTVASAKTVSSLLSSEETQALLQEVPKAYQTQVNDVLLTALVRAYCQWTTNNALFLTLEGHGREDLFPDVNLSRTVGWFTTHFPILLSLEPTLSTENALKSIKEQLRRVPHNGVNYGVLKHLSQDSLLQTKSQPQLKFNYLGQFDRVFQDTSLFQLADQTTDLNRSQQATRSHLLEIDGIVTNGQLRFNWTYSQNIHRSTTIESLAESFTEALRYLIAHCQSPDVGGYTPSDFPEAEFSQTELDKLLTKISKMSR